MALRLHPTLLQVEPGKTYTQANEKTIDDLLDKSEKIIHHSVQAEQQTRERGDERVQRTKQGGCCVR